MPNQPLVSVCIPVFNGEKFLKETIDCVLNQTYKNIELVFSDNYSTDNTVEIINSYKNDRIKLFKNQTNEGIYNNYVKVLKLGTGKYITFLGADDLMDFTCVEKSVKLLEEDSSLVLINTHIQIINDMGEKVYTKKYFFGSGKLNRYWAIRANLFYGSNLLGEPNGSLFLKSAFDKIPEPLFSNSNNWTFDIDMKLELILQGETFMIPEPLGYFRISSNSTSKKLPIFTQSRLFRKYAYNLYKDKRYNLSFFWVITATVNSIILEIARNIFYKLFIKNHY